MVTIKMCRVALGVSVALLANVTATASTCADYQSARSTWVSNMTTYGRQWGDYLNPASGRSADTLLEAVYYDGEWVFTQIGEFTGQTSPWDQYTTWARRAYIDGYLIPNNYGAAGYRRFSHGMLRTFEKRGPVTLEQILAMRDRPSFSNLSEYRNEYLGTMESVSRELAYAIQANINAEKAGAVRSTEGGRARVEVMVGWMEEHLKQWESGQYLPGDPAPRFAPFMAALSAHALIEFIEWEERNGRDPNRVWGGTYAPTIQASLRKFFAWMMDSATTRSGTNQRMWGQRNGLYGMLYEDTQTNSDLAYDLNNLLAYPYAWLAKRYENGSAAEQTDARRFMVAADELFIGNVRSAWLGGPKQFNQSYRLSFLYQSLKGTSALGLCSGLTTPRAPSLTVQ